MHLNLLIADRTAVVSVATAAPTVCAACRVRRA
jgi:hypothetical protein